MNTAIWRNMRMSALLMVIGLLSASIPVQQAGADVSGRTYTSPTYGYTITWPEIWDFVDEGFDPVAGDTVVLSDGLSTATISGLETEWPDPRLQVNSFVRYMSGALEFDNVIPLVTPTRGGPDWDDRHATMTISYSCVGPADSATELTLRGDVRRFGSNLQVKAVLVVPADSYPGYETIWDELLAGIAPPPDLSAESLGQDTGDPGELETVAHQQSYVSPNYGYSIAWPPDWYLDRESFELGGQDFLFLTDGLSMAMFEGSSCCGGSAAMRVARVFQEFNSASNKTELIVQTDSEGNELREFTEAHAYMTVSYTLTYADGTSHDLIERYEAFQIGPSEVLLVILWVPEAFYDGYAEVWDELVAGITPAVDRRN